MLQKKVVIKNESGLHARPASLLVREATKYKSEIFILKEGNEYNCKSIMNVMSMVAKKGQELTLKVEGSDEKEALEGLYNLLENLEDE
ncbi:MAG: HPr family phosphocarrier protein [Clostridiaceae bacterium]|nr:HPr family phosphocarrier protein [Clostridiaceae bacterium]